MNINSILSMAKLAINKNSTTILTTTAVVGVLSTGLFAVRGGVAATKAIQHDEWLNGTDSTPTKRMIKLSWPFFVPAVITGGTTIACILGANHISARRSAVLAGAYSLSEKALYEYKQITEKHLGEAKSQKVREELAQTKVDSIANNNVFVFSDGDVLCMEEFTGRYFTSSLEKIRSAENYVNREALHGASFGCQLNELYNQLGLSPTLAGDEFGWNSDVMLDIEITAAVAPDGKPCLVMGYKHNPFPKYYAVHAGRLRG